MQLHKARQAVSVCVGCGLERMPTPLNATRPTASNCTMKRSMLGLAALVTIALPGCVVHEREVVRAPPRCPGGVWVEGHYGPQGRWHPAHWRCPGVVEEVVVVHE